MNSSTVTLSPPGVAMTTEFDKYVQFPDAYAIERVWFYLVGVAGTLVGCVGLVCNFLSLGILLHHEMRSSTATLYLIALVIYDTVFLVFNTIFITVEYFYFGLTGKMDWYNTYVLPSTPVVNAFLNVSITGSAYTTIALGIDRCIGVKRPFQWSNVCTPFRVRLVLVGVFILSCTLNVPLIMENRLEWQTSAETNETKLVSVDSEYSTTYFHTKVYLKYINPAFDAVLPVAIIAVVNVIIGVTLRQRKTLSTTLSADGRGREQAGRDTMRITLQVIIISLCTLISRALRVSTFLILEHHGTVMINFCPLYCGTIAAVSIFWNILNATVNFFLYCYFGQKFRKCFMQAYTCWKCCKRDPDSPYKFSKLLCCHGFKMTSSSSDYNLTSVTWTSTTSLRTLTSKPSVSLNCEA